MNNIKIFSTADWHFHSSNEKDFFISFNYFLAKAQEERPDLISIAGDIFDRPVLNSSDAAFDRFLMAIKRLLEVAPVVTVYGTPTHDVPGSLKVLEEIKGIHSFRVLQPSTPYFLTMSGGVTSEPEFAKDQRLLILGIPEVSEEWIKKDADSQCREIDVNAALKQLLAGYMALRESYSHIPCLLLYHGPINGAKISDSQKLPAGSIELGWRDLASIKADYISCGHIHMAQEVGKDINGFYEGSFFPNTWGELTKKQFSIITLNTDLHEVQREIEYLPHPIREKLKYSLLDNNLEELIDFIRMKDVSGKLIWLELTMDQDQTKNLDLEQVQKILDSTGCLIESRVTKRVIRIETLRAGQITEKKTIFEKVEVWAEHSGLNVSPRIRKRCEELENEIRAQGFSHDPRQLRLDYVFLKGNKGVWKGMRKKQIEIDFRKFTPGTLAFIGDNGKGKSSIIKQCNPYPDPIENGGKTADDFFLKDSRSITIWTDVLSGNRFKALKEIDGRKGKTGTTAKYYLYIDKGQGWEPYNEEQQGRQLPFKTAVLEVFGSPELFKRSAYVAQKNNDLPSTPKERKELFNELIGNDYLEKLSSTAIEKRKAVEKDLISIEGKISVIEESVKMIPEIETQLSNENSAKEEADKILAVLETEGKKLKGDLEKIQKENEENERIHEQIGILQGDIQDLQNQIQDLEGEIRTLENTSKQLPELKKKLQENNQKKKEADSIKFKIQGLTNERTSLNEEYNTYVQGYQKESSSLTTKRNDLEKQRIEITGKISSGQDRFKFLQEKIESLQDPCEDCGHIKNSAQEEIKTANSEISEIRKNDVSLKDSFNELVLHMDRLNKEINTLQEQKNKRDLSHSGKLSSINEQINSRSSELEKVKPLSESEEQSLQANVKTGETAEIEIAAKTRILNENREKLGQKQEKLKQNEEKYDILLKNRLKTASENYESKREEYSNQNAEIAGISERLKSLSAELEKLNNQKDELQKLESSIQENKEAFADWTFLERGLGRDGVQALELDACAPTIAAQANTLLERTFGSRYELLFETIKDVGTGKDTHQAETFEILITDHEETEEDLVTQSISTLSGGEERWFLKALYDAFGIIREQNTGLKYLTAFQDEADGALSPEKKYLYLKMMEAAHEEAGRTHTVYITHDKTIQQVIPQKIQIEDLPDLDATEEEEETQEVVA